MKLAFLASPLLVLLVACGGTAATPPPGDAGGDATGPADASTDANGTSDANGTTDAGGDVVTRPDGGAACRTEAPTHHRPSAASCPSHETDAGTDAGLTGCMPPSDACLVDSDCGGSGVCDCEAPRCTHPFATTGNVCLPGNCRIDSDCACGFCAGESSCGGLDGYWCTTPRDECATDADCQDAASISGCRWSADHWACVALIGCPG